MKSKYGFDSFEVSETRKVETENLKALCASASIFGKKNGMKFSIRKTEGGAHVTRLS